MSAGRDRRARRAARRAEIDGSGPVTEERPPATNPGAHGVFALFGEVLLVGVLVALVSVLLVTLPAALAAGMRHLHRFIAAEDTSLALFWDDVRRAALPGTAVGAGLLAVAAVLSLNLHLAGSGLLPGGAVVQVVGWVGLALLALVLLLGSGAWNPEDGWVQAMRRVPGLIRVDPPGALYVMSAAGFVVVVTWASTPLLVPALGCAALAVVAIPARPKGRPATRTA